MLDENAVIKAYKRPQASHDLLAGILNVQEQEILRSVLFDLIVPELSPETRIGTLVRWIKCTGETVEQDEPILEISTELVDTEIPCPIDGTLVEVLVHEGTQIRINETVVARLRPALEI